jgi:two-component system chemotaxis response regulator CheY
MEFQIIEAEDGEKALEVCKRGLPDAILLDWNMPVMDGYEFLGICAACPAAISPRWCSARPKME